MGYPKVKLPETAQPSIKSLFVRYLYLLGVTEPETVAKLWAAELEARAKVKRGR